MTISRVIELDCEDFGLVWFVVLDSIATPKQILKKTNVESIAEKGNVSAAGTCSNLRYVKETFEMCQIYNVKIVQMVKMDH